MLIMALITQCICSVYLLVGAPPLPGKRNLQVMLQHKSPCLTRHNQCLIDLDVTALVKDIQQYGNYGFLLKLQNETIYTSRIFCSSLATDATKHPKLVIQ